MNEPSETFSTDAYLLEQERELQIRAAARAVKREALSTAEKWPAFRSVHEGFAVLLEEVHELWDEVRAKTVDPLKLRQEAIHVSAMALRIAGELAPREIPE
jgi:NTP pyrophosphatase (non-canonical NTP hydrolase)